MQRRQIIIAGVATALIVVLFVVLQGNNSSSDSGSSHPSFSLEFANGQPVGGVKTLSVSQNDSVTISMHTDTHAELHVHTSPEHAQDIKAGHTGSVAFSANATGKYEVEAHPLINGQEQAGVQLAELVINP